MTKGSSHASWDGVTGLFKNSSYSQGGAICSKSSPTVSWTNNITFVGNEAWIGGAIYAASSTLV